ncbi:mannose-6-phosphate isomerase [Kineococcus sp. R8]|uniref:class I mannose-6-phosphate isomerase n=1 Tax=Kineococcus siccus TaxID=2696567 RepID=UPI001411C2B4|nr:class I mannose-6-phosphate isomerase [Kineococcus siccus]NAZ81665.1 mannose-6-phosphate isomerase [Kineococcus siccus]
MARPGAPADWYPLRLSTPVKPHVFGGHAIARTLGRRGLPDWSVAETWECSDVDGTAGSVVDGPLAGTSLRQLVLDHPEELVGAGWSGEFFPVLTKFIDATGTLPVHLHADDATAQRREGQENGKTEAWHVLAAAPGATALCGVREGVTREQLRAALEAQDADAVLRRLPLRAGETVHVPGGTLHSFGPDTLVYEIEQTSDVQQHAMRWNMEDGSPVPDEEWHANLDALLAEVDLAPRPHPVPALGFTVADGVRRTFLTACPSFALERWTAGTTAPLRHRFATAQIVSNVGAPVLLRSGGHEVHLGGAETVLLPAALGEVEVAGPADVLLGYLPDLDRDVRAPLAAAGFSPEVVATLGEVSAAA